MATTNLRILTVEALPVFSDRLGLFVSDEGNVANETKLLLFDLNKLNEEQKQTEPDEITSVMIPGVSIGKEIVRRVVDNPSRDQWFQKKESEFCTRCWSISVKQLCEWMLELNVEKMIMLLRWVEQNHKKHTTMNREKCLQFLADKSHQLRNLIVQVQRMVDEKRQNRKSWTSLLQKMFHFQVELNNFSLSVQYSALAIQLSN